MANLYNEIKNIVNSVMQSYGLTDLQYGRVISTQPLKIKISDRIILEKNQILLTENVMDIGTEVTIKWNTEESSFDTTHKHGIAGRKPIQIHNSLKVGNQVILLRVKQGQKFIVLSKVEAVD